MACMPPAMPWPALPDVYARRPLCRGGMGEALWIRRGTLARTAWETTLNRRCIALPYPPWPGTSICAFSNTRFSCGFIALPVLNMRISQPRAYDA